MLSCEVPSQLVDHAGGGPPDKVLLPGDPVDGVLFSASGKGQGDVVAPIQQMGQRHFEGMIHLIRTQDEGIVAIEQPQHRQHLES